ncbi:YHYH protein [Corynebacterium alimapuense]|uniref:YHYH domain-containing protein n=1 Tax=Corynebacterium alimapuense TaxID=1576874 RepID=A0A3M8K6Y9_9CORY|nr:YHYH protein [Corynebacterium alimapuense]RNE48332.1 hypothetical protein C5L39_07370 [Corynebacterium alimapuense]
MKQDNDRPSSARRSLRVLPPAAVSVAALFLLTACGSGDSDSEESASATDATTTTEAELEVTPAGLNIDLFKDGALAQEPTIEDCILSDGSASTCYNLTISGYPLDDEVGPFCPETITDTADQAGIWFDGEDIYSLDGPFFEQLPELYGDDAWQMYDEEGNIFVTDTKEKFELAAQPNVDESVMNHCVEGRLEWLENGEPVQATVLIPTEPVAAAEPASATAFLGVTLSGVRIDAAAPVTAILDAHTIAAFDNCGGHFNPTEGYHMHGAVGCSEVEGASEGETLQFGYALDGYPVHSPYDEQQAAEVELDECNGHYTEAEGYHYHANPAEENQVITCMIGQTAEAEVAAGGPPGGGAPAGGPPAGGAPPEGAAR